MPDGNWESKYKSPISIETICEEITEKINNEMLCYVYDITRKYAIVVDKEELLKALQYDRNQFREGYLKGCADARADIIRCKDCKHYSKPTENTFDTGLCYESHTYGWDQVDYCSKAEKNEEGVPF